MMIKARRVFLYGIYKSNFQKDANTKTCYQIGSFISVFTLLKVTEICTCNSSKMSLNFTKEKKAILKKKVSDSARKMNELALKDEYVSAI